MVFNAIFNNIPVMSWLSVSLMEETTYLPRITAKIVVIRSRKTDNTMTKRNRIKGNQWSTKDYTENGRLSNKNPTKKSVNSGSSERWLLPASLVAPIMLYQIQCHIICSIWKWYNKHSCKIDNSYIHIAFCVFMNPNKSILVLTYQE